MHDNSLEILTRKKCMLITYLPEEFQDNESYVVTTGTGSGKLLSFFIPVVDRILKEKEKDSKPRTRAIIIYPMNAQASSQ